MTETRIDGGVFGSYGALTANSIPATAGVLIQANYASLYGLLDESATAIPDGDLVSKRFMDALKVELTACNAKIIAGTVA